MKKINLINLILILSATAIFAQTPVTIEFDEVRELTEINQYGVAEAYPWISEDGLRLYFTKDNYIFMAERASTIEEFSNPTQLAVNFIDHDNMGGKLSTDELEIYFTKRNPSEIGVNIIGATRTSINEQFNTIFEIEIIGINDIDDKIYFLACPDFTPDKSQMFVYHTYQTTEILILDKTAENQYTVADTLEIPEGYIVSPGSLSHSGLKYYLSLTNETTSEKLLYYFERENLDDDFTSLYFIENEEVYSFDKTPAQPHFSSDENFMVFAQNSNSWTSNDLVIAQNNPPPANITESIEISSLFPNPAKNHFTIKTSKQIPKNSILQIFSSNGLLMQQVQIKTAGNEIELNTENLESGAYNYFIITNNRKINGKFIIKK